MGKKLHVCYPSIFSMVQSLNYTVTMGDSKPLLCTT